MDQPSKKPSWKQFQKLHRTQRSLGQSVRQIEKRTVRHARRFVSSRLDRLSSIWRAVFGWAALILILTGVSTAQWLSFRQAYMIDAPATGGTYSEGVIGPLETLNPIFARSSAEKSAAKLLFASLYRYDETGNLKGDVARSVAVNEAQDTYTVTMRDDAKWSDGTSLTAADVEFTINALKNPETRAEISGWGAFEAKAVGDYKVEFKLPGAYAPFMHTLTFPILPQHALAGVRPIELREQAFSQSPVTSGPFALRLLQTLDADGPSKVAHMVANPLYHHGQAKLERFQLHSYQTREDVERALKTNEIMATSELTYATLPEATQRMYQSQDYSINDGVYALFNTRDGVLRSRTVREALALSVDREALREQLSRPSAPLDGPILHDQVDDLPAAPGSDIEKAKTQLNDAGWVVSGDVRKKDDRELALRMVALRGADFSQATEELAKIWREELNVKVDVEIVDPLDMSRSVIQTVLQPRNYDVLVYELVLGGDPDVYAYWHSSQATAEGLNFANYSNVVANDALSGGRARLDDRYRADRYKAFVRRWHADTPALALYQRKVSYIYSHSAQAMDPRALLVFPEDRYANVIYWSVQEASVYKTP